MADATSIELKAGDGASVIVVRGSWTLATVSGLDSDVRALQPDRRKPVNIDLGAVDLLDTAGAWVLFRLRERLRSEGCDASFAHLGDSHEGLFHHIGVCNEHPPMPMRRFRPFQRLADRTGYHACQTWLEVRDMMSFFGELILTMIRVLMQPRRLKVVSIISHMEQVGINSLPIVGLLTFLVGVVLTFQGADQLRRFGTEIFTVNLLGISFLRETGILMTAIIIAGRSGSAFAAQIGTMKVNEEVDAMRALGINPLELLVVPRVIALVLVMPLLGFFANIAGLTGGALMSIVALDLSIAQFLTQLNGAVPIWAFWVGIIKAPLFAFAIAMVGCYNGLKVGGSAESVGKMTTRAVVQSIFLVIVIDAMASVIFSFIGI
ncbi:MAG: MlaE family lipid ABC transporter permease subunit [Rhodospirillales bacterium]|nr:MlaE family lipid ABC transporter permease subunit [Rhodospirillales bacterium]